MKESGPRHNHDPRFSSGAQDLAYLLPPLPETERRRILEASRRVRRVREPWDYYFGGFGTFSALVFGCGSLYMLSHPFEDYFGLGAVVMGITSAASGGLAAKFFRGRKEISGSDFK